MLVLGTTTSVFASWWNPFTWSFFTKRQTPKVVNTVKKDPREKEKIGLYTSSSTSELVFTDAEKLVAYNYSDYSCGGYERKPNCNDVISYDSYKGYSIEIDGKTYKHTGGDRQKTTQKLFIDIATFTFAANLEKEVNKIIKSNGMATTTLVTSGNYEEMKRRTNEITPNNPIKFSYVVGRDAKNTYQLVVTRYGCGGDAMGCSGDVYLEKSATSTPTQSQSSLRSNTIAAFKGETITGVAPLAVSFANNISVTGIDFGDKTNCTDLDAPELLLCKKDGTFKTHTYTSPGTYMIIGTKNFPSRVVGETTVIVK